MDGREHMESQGHIDECSDENVVSKSFAKRAVCNGIGKLNNIEPIKLELPLKDNSNARVYSL